jgi:hypothetical protein
VKTKLGSLGCAIVGVAAVALSHLPAVAQSPGADQPDLTPLSVYNVKRYGARGDGITDDTAAIRATIAAGGSGFDGTSAARVVFFPVGMYKITASIDVPPNVVLRGASRFSTNLTGSTINVAFDGAGIRLVRRNSSPGSLFHLGGIEDLAFSGMGSAVTSASRFIELGDSRAVNMSTGAWNVFIRRCVFNYSHGYGIYSAHSQEAQIDSNWFRTVKFPISFPTVIGAARIMGNTLLDETRIPGAIGMQFRPGVLGGGMGPQLMHNYLLGFEYGFWVTSMVGPTITGNTFEGTYRTPIVLDRRGANDAPPDGSGTVGFTIEGNTFINWAASATDFPAIQLNSARGGFVGANAYQSPNGAATTIINYADGGPDWTRDNILVEPVLTGSGTARPFPAGNPILARNSVLGRTYFQQAGVAGDLTTAGFGAAEAGRTWWDAVNRRFRVWDGTQVRLLALPRQVVLSHGPSVRINAALGSWFAIVITDAAPRSIADPEQGTHGQVITVTIRNSSGGSVRAVRWGSAYKMGDFTPPANGSNRSVTFAYDSIHWVEIARTTVDVPN